MNTMEKGILIAGAAFAVGAIVVMARNVKTDKPENKQALFGPDNPINAGVLALGRKVSGDANFSLGGWWYDVTHEPVISSFSERGQTIRVEKPSPAQAKSAPAQATRGYYDLGAKLPSAGDGEKALMDIAPYMQ